MFGKVLSASLSRVFVAAICQAAVRLCRLKRQLGRALKPGEIIDVDIEAIYETAAAVGLNEREMDGVEIVFASRRHSEILPSGCSGYYQYQNGRHYIKIRCDKDAAKTARHELQHMADEQGGVLYEDNRPAILKFASAAGERIENCSSRAVLAATGAEVLAFTNSFDKCSLYCGIVAAASICVAGLAKVYYIFGYISHPAEVRARQAEKLDTPFGVLHLIYDKTFSSFTIPSRGRSV